MAYTIVSTVIYFQHTLGICTRNRFPKFVHAFFCSKYPKYTKKYNEKWWTTQEVTEHGNVLWCFHYRASQIPIAQKAQWLHKESLLLHKPKNILQKNFSHQNTNNHGSKWHHPIKYSLFMRNSSKFCPLSPQWFPCVMKWNIRNVFFLNLGRYNVCIHLTQ